VADAVWSVLNSLAVGGAIWLGTILLLALLGELGLPFTCPIIESLLVFTGFQLVHGTLLVAVLPFLAVAYGGRLLGSTSAYQLSARVGTDLLQRHNRWIRVTPQRIEQLRTRLSSLVVPTIMLARFTPGLTVLTSFVCGVSAMRPKQFVGAVAAQLVVWEMVFIAAGALGGVAFRSMDPATYPKAVILIICISIPMGAIGAYILFNSTRRRTRVQDTSPQATTTSRVR